MSLLHIDPNRAAFRVVLRSHLVLRVPTRVDPLIEEPPEAHSARFFHGDAEVGGLNGLVGVLFEIVLDSREKAIVAQDVA